MTEISADVMNIRVVCTIEQADDEFAVELRFSHLPDQEVAELLGDWLRDLLSREITPVLAGKLTKRRTKQ